MLAIRKGSATKGVAMYEIEEPEVQWALEGFWTMELRYP